MQSKRNVAIMIKLLFYFVRSLRLLKARLLKTKIGKKCYINKRSKFTKNTVIGSDCHFNGIRIMGQGVVSIGNHFHSGADVKIITDVHNYDCGEKLPYDDTYIVKNVIIEENVWIGDNVIILGGSIIGEGAIIQAGSVVVGEIPPLSIAGGHPAKPFKRRNENHYFALKKKQKA